MNILERCDKVLYQQVRMSEFLARVKASTANMHANSASCYYPPVKGMIDSCLEVCATVLSTHP